MSKLLDKSLPYPRLFTECDGWPDRYTTEQIRKKAEKLGVHPTRVDFMMIDDPIGQPEEITGEYLDRCKAWFDDYISSKGRKR